MKCLVIDDEPMALEIVRDYIEKVPFLSLAKTFGNSVKALDYLLHEEIDLIFLDINMPDLSGIQFLKALPAHPMVILTTTYSQYAAESHEHDAVDYLLKPIEFDRFIKSANKALEQFNLSNFIAAKSNEEEKKESIHIKSGNSLVNIKIKDVIYIQGVGNNVIFMTREKEIMSLLTMNDVLQILPSDLFFRIHKSFIVNFQHIDLIEKEQVKIKDTSLPIGEIFRKMYYI